MTAKELAEKLLQYPDYEVFTSCDSKYEDMEKNIFIWDNDKIIYFGY